MKKLRRMKMSSMAQDLLNNIQESGTSELLISQKLNKLFYEPTDPIAESKFVRAVLNKNGEQKDRVGLHASAIITSEKDFCYREQVLSLFYKQDQGKQIPINLKRIFEEGNSIHEKWQRLFLRGGLVDLSCLDRSRFDYNYDLSFTPDICPAIIGKKQYVVEIKSVNTFQFKNMNEHPSGKKQLMFYMHLTNVFDGFVLAEDKNTQKFKTFIYKFDKEIVLPYIERLENIQVYKSRLLNENKMVAGICKAVNSPRAQKCPMRDACFNCGIGRIRL